MAVPQENEDKEETKAVSKDDRESSPEPASEEPKDDKDVQKEDRSNKGVDEEVGEDSTSEKEEK